MPLRSFGHQVSHPTLGSLGQPEKAMGHESRIEPWSPHVGWGTRKSPAVVGVFFLDFPFYRTYQESKRAASDSFPPCYVRDDSARAHVQHKRERYTEHRNNQHGLLKASGPESFRDRG